MASPTPLANSKVTLEHLVLVPIGGLANRMRPIASAKRICELSGARCTVVWDWPEYEALFAADPAIEVVPRIPSDVARNYEAMRTRTAHEGGTPENRRIPLAGPPRIVLTSFHSFCTSSDAAPVDVYELLPWMPRPSQVVLDRVHRFSSQAFPAGPVVGMHMRRTDKESSFVLSPDWLFIHQAESLADEGVTIYLATDNRKTERKMLSRLDTRIVMYPKNPGMARRWPRAFNLEETIDDYADLLLLSSCDYVLGSANSSYSHLAMAFNGSPRCRVLRGPDRGWLFRARKLWAYFVFRENMRRQWENLRRRLQPGIGIGRAIARLWKGLPWGG